MKLRDYQQVGVGFLREQNRSALFLDMGLGKTAIALRAFESRHLPALVVAPKRVVSDVWPVELEKWRPDLSIAVAAGSPDERAAALRAGADLTVISWDNFRDVFKARSPRPWRTLILDELSGYKKKQSVRWRTANRLIWHKTSKVLHVWGLTGTPSPNGLIDLWAQVYLLDRGQRLFTTLGEYRARYFTPGRRIQQGPVSVVVSWDVVPGMDEKIHASIEDICLSMGTEGRVELPPIVHNEVTVTLPPKAVKAYAELRADLVTDLELLGGEIHTAKNAAMLTNKLSQVTAGFIYSDDADINHGKFTQLHTEKLKAVQEIIEGTGGGVLVAYGYKPEREMLLAGLEGARSIDEPNVIQDWNAGRVPVLVTHPASAGHGLNLQDGGHTIVWTSLPWSLELWDQFNKRLHRSGQKNSVTIHRVCARTPKGTATVDHLIHQRLTGKAGVQQALLDHLEVPL